MIKKNSNIFLHIFRKIKDKLSLSDKGERVDINYNKNQKLEEFDIYQKSHFLRYEYAKKILDQKDVVGDFACGTGYGTLILSEKSVKVIGVDINERVIKTIKQRYRENKKVEFIIANILDLKYKNYFNKIISFETIEHFEEKDISKVFNIFFKALTNNGKLIFSVPYMQEKSKKAIRMGFHKKFNIDEKKIKEWLNQAGFKSFSFKYQNYKTHEILEKLDEKDFAICLASKQDE